MAITVQHDVPFTTTGRAAYITGRGMMADRFDERRIRGAQFDRQMKDQKARHEDSVALQREQMDRSDQRFYAGLTANELGQLRNQQHQLQVRELAMEDFERQMKMQYDQKFAAEDKAYNIEQQRQIEQIDRQIAQVKQMGPELTNEEKALFLKQLYAKKMGVTPTGSPKYQFGPGKEIGDVWFDEQMGGMVLTRTAQGEVKVLKDTMKDQVDAAREQAKLKQAEAANQVKIGTEMAKHFLELKKVLKNDGTAAYTDEKAMAAVRAAFSMIPQGQPAATAPQPAGQVPQQTGGTQAMEGDPLSVENIAKNPNLVPYVGQSGPTGTTRIRTAMVRARDAGNRAAKNEVRREKLQDQMQRDIEATIRRIPDFVVDEQSVQLLARAYTDGYERHFEDLDYTKSINEFAAKDYNLNKPPHINEFFGLLVEPREGNPVEAEKSLARVYDHLFTQKRPVKQIPKPLFNSLSMRQKQRLAELIRVMGISLQ
jgi:hypothetical protein